MKKFTNIFALTLIAGMASAAFAVTPAAATKDAKAETTAVKSTEVKADTNAAPKVFTEKTLTPVSVTATTTAGKTETKPAKKAEVKPASEKAEFKAPQPAKTK